ncbi:hypothetical protein [Calycomorphotria hydatis]|uniref:hypothetical protein n=1 Tax=Calycomorphotria hydatis TaxID=2528027 RepID=UPI0011A52525|nr:hypothetical protein [Calycomorphotria hydatis]
MRYLELFLKNTSYVSNLMLEDKLIYDGLYQLTTHADHLNAINTPNPVATATYELMSGALIWSDETKADTPVYVICALRQLFAYRTRLMLDDAEPDNDFWDQCVKLFPNWIGFLPERRKQTPELLAEYRRGDVSTKACLRKLEHEIDANDT